MPSFDASYPSKQEANKTIAAVRRFFVEQGWQIAPLWHGRAAACFEARKGARFVVIGIMAHKEAIAVPHIQSFMAFLHAHYGANYGAHYGANYGANYGDRIDCGALISAGGFGEAAMRFVGTDPTLRLNLGVCPDPEAADPVSWVVANQDLDPRNGWDGDPRVSLEMAMQRMIATAAMAANSRRERWKRLLHSTRGIFLFTTSALSVPVLAAGLALDQAPNAPAKSVVVAQQPDRQPEKSTRDGKVPSPSAPQTQPQVASGAKTQGSGKGVAEVAVQRSGKRRLNEAMRAGWLQWHSEGGRHHGSKHHVHHMHHVHHVHHVHGGKATRTKSHPLSRTPGDPRERDLVQPGSWPSYLGEPLTAAERIGNILFTSPEARGRCAVFDGQILCSATGSEEWAAPKRIADALILDTLRALPRNSYATVQNAAQVPNGLKNFLQFAVIQPERDLEWTLTLIRRVHSIMRGGRYEIYTIPDKFEALAKDPAARTFATLRTLTPDLGPALGPDLGIQPLQGTAGLPSSPTAPMAGGERGATLAMASRGAAAAHPTIPGDAPLHAAASTGQPPQRQMPDLAGGKAADRPAGAPPTKPPELATGGGGSAATAAYTPGLRPASLPGTDAADAGPRARTVNGVATNMTLASMTLAPDNPGRKACFNLLTLDPYRPRSDAEQIVAAVFRTDEKDGVQSRVNGLKLMKEAAFRSGIANIPLCQKEAINDLMGTGGLRPFRGSREWAILSRAVDEKAAVLIAQGYYGEQARMAPQFLIDMFQERAEDQLRSDLDSAGYIAIDPAGWARIKERPLPEAKLTKSS
jgi:hypothetical protein